jgi:transposase
MLDGEDRLMLKVLEIEGLSISAIARETEHDRKTVRKYLTSGMQMSQIKKRRRIPVTLCESFNENLISHIRNGLSAKEIYRDLITNHNFLGSYESIKLYVRQQGQNLQSQSHQDEYFASLWVLKLLQGEVQRSELESQFKGNLNARDISALVDCVLNKPLGYRNRAITILLYLKRISKSTIANALFLEPKTVREYIRRFEEGGVENLLDLSRKSIKKSEDQDYKNAVFSILHAPPSCYGINRTTWRMADIKHIMSKNGLPISRDNIRKIIKDAGYKFRKAKKVLTSTDPNYMEKLREITKILTNLGPKEKFFSIDEFGPFAVKMQGGMSLVPPGHAKTIPQWQKSKGSLIITGALELSTNQITHFYSEKKNTDEMIKLMEILLADYKDEDCIYLSWDDASWHGSKKLYKKVEEINSFEYRKKHNVPIVKLAPLPSCAQFLNVIESVFSGMARAIIHNSDYQSVAECKDAIDRHFTERNQYFRENPKRAGNKIWGNELVEAKFSESNNCKNPSW